MTVSINGTNGLVFSDGTSQNTSPFTGGFAFRNKLINGAMQIDQRNAGASVSINNPAIVQYTVDRWAGYGSVASKFTVQQNAGSITPPVGFKNYLGAVSSSAYSIASTDGFVLLQYIEGNNVSDLGWGAAGAATVTLSFWVRSSLTGTFGGAVRNGAGNRGYPFSYTINTANTWEQKSVTIAGDTTGTWTTDNSAGITILFSLGTGSTQSGTAGSWQSGLFASCTGATSVVGTNGATFYITGVQLEKGSTATSFDYRPYGTELALCQRYYETSDGVESFSAGATGFSTNTYTDTGFFKVSKRAAPSMAFQKNDGTIDQCQMWKGGVEYTGLNPGVEQLNTHGFSMKWSNASVTDAGLMRFKWQAISEL